jgi:hypothetical protein
MKIPEPEPGLVISYSYLWRNESDAGQHEGEKNRPCAILLVIKRGDDDEIVAAVAPLTHTPPHHPDVAIEIPSAVKKYLKLDDARSWIILDDLNVFSWPGYDLRLVPGTKDRCNYGLLPPRFFKKLIAKYTELRHRQHIRTTSRDDNQ